MKKRAVITIRSNVSAEEDDLIEVSTPGDFFITDEGFRIEYYETQISGMEGTRTTILVREKSFELIREGSTETKMEFEYMKGNISLYKTPYGILEMEIYTKKLYINMTENGGKITTDYTLTLEGQETAKTHLTVEVKINKIQ